MSTIEDGPAVDYMELGGYARGSIGETVETRPRLDECTDRLGSGEFHVATDLILPCGCIDGRPGCKVRPDAAGGTLTLAVADDLLEQRFAGDGSTVAMARNVYRFLADAGHETGGHTAESATGDASGCGANDKLADIYRIITEQADTIRTITESIGVVVSDADHTAAVAGAGRRQEFSSGRDVLDDAMVAVAGVDQVDVLRGPHHEVVTVINRRAATTLDREALHAEFGDEYQAFNVDAWTFDASARVLYPDADDEMIRRTVTAMAYYNIATALALCGPTMRVVVLD